MLFRPVSELKISGSSGQLNIELDYSAIPAPFVFFSPSYSREMNVTPP